MLCTFGAIVGSIVGAGVAVASAVGVTATAGVSSFLSLPPKLHADISTDAVITIAVIASNFLFFIITFSL